MNKVKYRLTLDLQKPGIQHTIYAKKNDCASREVIFTLRDGSKPYIITDDVKAYLYALAGDANIFVECEINKNTVVATLSTNMLACDTTTLELRLTDLNEQILSSPQINVVCENGIYSDEAITASDEFSALFDAISKANDARIVNISTEAQSLVITYADGSIIECEITPGQDLKKYVTNEAFETFKKDTEATLGNIDILLKTI